MVDKAKKDLSKGLLTFQRPLELDGLVIYNIFVLMLGSSQMTSPS